MASGISLEARLPTMPLSAEMSPLKIIPRANALLFFIALSSQLSYVTTLSRLFVARSAVSSRVYNEQIGKNTREYSALTPCSFTFDFIITHPQLPAYFGGA